MSSEVFIDFYKELLNKIDLVIKQNKEILSENKTLIKQNDDLILSNDQLKLEIQCNKQEMHQLTENIKDLEEVVLDSQLKSKKDKFLAPTASTTQTEKNVLSAKKEERHSILITPTNETPFTPDTYASKIKSNITSKLNTVQIKKMKLTKKGQVVIDLADEFNKNEAMKSLENEEFNVKTQTKPNGIFPKITIYGIDSDEYNAASKEKLLSDIKNKNPAINALMLEGKLFEIVFIKEVLNRFGEKSCQAVVKLDPAILQKLDQLSASKPSKAIIYTNTTVCRYSNRFHILQCYVCQSFGHKAGSSFCPYNNTDVNICMYCSENHKSRNCPNKMDTEKHKCSNCLRFGNKTETSENICHSTTDLVCPVYQRQMKAIVRNTAGIEVSSKNYHFGRKAFVT